MNNGLWEHFVAISAESDMDHMISIDSEGSYKCKSVDIAKRLA